MNTTEGYNFLKPEQGEYYNVDTQNTNMDMIESQLLTIRNDIQSLGANVNIMTKKIADMEQYAMKTYSGNNGTLNNLSLSDFKIETIFHAMSAPAVLMYSTGNHADAFWVDNPAIHSAVVRLLNNSCLTMSIYKIEKSRSFGTMTVAISDGKSIPETIVFALSNEGEIHADNMHVVAFK